jgi:hypothetical protein
MKLVLIKLLNYLNLIRYKNTKRVFCISMQRTGTTSVGQFFKDFNFRWAGWPQDKSNKWSMSCYEGDFDKIFLSPDFIKANAFEDSPWFYPEFYKILYHKFPNTKFVLFTRDPNDWFDSMVSHSKNNILGRSRSHSKVYRRELEYFDYLNKVDFDEKKENDIDAEKTMKLTGQREHYINIYRRHNIEVQDFFKRHSPDSLIVCELGDPDKWQKLGFFLDVNVPSTYDSRQNASKKEHVS